MVESQAADILCRKVGIEKTLNLVENAHAVPGAIVSLLRGRQAVQSPVWIASPR